MKIDFFDSDNEKLIEDESKSNMNVNSLPVGKKFEKRKRRTVTFNQHIITRK